MTMRMSDSEVLRSLADELRIPGDKVIIRIAARLEQLENIEKSLREVIKSREEEYDFAVAKWKEAVKKKESYAREVADKQSVEFMKFNAEIAYKGDDVWLDFVNGVEYTTSQLLAKFHESNQP